jgi:hypothetical protein
VAGISEQLEIEARILHFGQVGSVGKLLVGMFRSYFAPFLIVSVRVRSLG